MTAEPQSNSQINSHLVPAKVAAARVGYTLDYVSRLAREGKVAALRQGRAWYIDLESVKLFSLEAAAEQRRRSEELRRLRKLELVRQQQISSMAIDSTLEHPSYTSLGQAAVLTLALAMCLSLSWTAYDAKLNMQAFSFGAISISEIFFNVFGVEWPFTQESKTIEVSQTKPSLPAASAGVVTETSGSVTTSPAEGLVVLPSDATDEEIRSIQESFSDEVKIEYLDDGTGVITPQFRERDSDSYRFLLVPVKKEDL